MDDSKHGKVEGGPSPLTTGSQSGPLSRRTRRNAKIPSKLQDQIIEFKSTEVPRIIDGNIYPVYAANSDAGSGNNMNESETDNHVRKASNEMGTERGKSMTGIELEKSKREAGDNIGNSQPDGNDNLTSLDTERARPMRQCRAQSRLLTDESTKEDHDSVADEPWSCGAGVGPETSNRKPPRRKKKGRICKNCGQSFSSKSSLLSHQSACRTPAQRRKREEKTKCVFCRITFLSKHDRDVHLRDEHRRKKVYPCYMCDRIFGDSSHCKRHFLSHTGEKPYSCGICGKEFADNSYIQRHMLIHSGHKPFQCHQCGRTFRERTHLSRHAETHQKEGDLCPGCGKALYGEVNRCTCTDRAKRTRAAPDSATEKNFTCGECGRGFAKEGNFQRHLLEHERGSPTVAVFTCKVCHKEFKQERHLQRHQRIHTGEKPFRCSVCGKQFRDSSYIRRHMRIHAGHRPFQCDVCSRTFRENGHLARHMLTHTGEKKFSCSTCGKGYQDKTCLLRHESKCVVSNIDEKVPELCDICGKEYIGKSSLRRHQQMHTGQRNYQCTQCPAQFFDSSSLRRHLGIHNRDPETLNQCPQCKKLFRTRRALTQHMMIHLHEAPADRYECKLCDAEFPNRETLTAHAVSHSGQSLSLKLEVSNEGTPLSLGIDLECKFCHKLFASPSILASHEITHAQSLLDDPLPSTTGVTAPPSEKLSAEVVAPQLLDHNAATNDFEGLMKLLQVISQFNQNQGTIVAGGDVIDVSVTTCVPGVMDGRESNGGSNHLQLNRNASNIPVVGSVPAGILAAGISSAGYTISGESSADGVIRLDLVPSDSGAMCIAEPEPAEPPPEGESSAEPTMDTAERDANSIEVGSLNIENPGLGDPTLGDSSLDDASFDADDMLTEGEEYGEEFPCQYCSFVSRRDKVLAAHMASDHSDIVFARQIPSKKEAEERPQLWQCPFCNKVFDFQLDLREHSCEGVKEKPFKCPHCPMRFPKRPILTQHIKVHEGDPQYKCSFCQRAFHFKNSLAYHERIHTQEVPYLCQVCGKGFKDKSHLRRHEKIHEGVKPYACQICPKRFLERSQLVKHSRVHSGEKPYLCSKCGKRFADASHLRRHSDLHRGTREKKHKCVTCQKAFKTPDGLRAHAKTHTEGEALPCQVCGKKFPNQGMLNRHIRCHDKERPFTCHFCSKQFRVRSELVKHFRIHTGDKPYSCSYCGKQFIEKSQCKRHVMVAHVSSRDQCSELSFCDICGEAFTESALLEEHMKGHITTPLRITPDMEPVETE